MRSIGDEGQRTDLLNRLKRAEGQLRGIQRMISEGEPCLAIAGQMAAVRKALDSAYVRMTVCYLQHELVPDAGTDARKRKRMDAMLEDVESLLAKLR